MNFLTEQPDFEYGEPSSFTVFLQSPRSNYSALSDRRTMSRYVDTHVFAVVMLPKLGPKVEGS